MYRCISSNSCCSQEKLLILSKSVTRVLDFLLKLKLAAHAWCRRVKWIFKFVYYLDFAPLLRLRINITWTLSYCMVREARLFSSNDLTGFLTLILLFEYWRLVTLWSKLNLLGHGSSLYEIFSRPMLVLIILASVLLDWVHSATRIVLFDIQILMSLVPLIMCAWDWHLLVQSIGLQHLNHLKKLHLVIVRVVSILRLDHLTWAHGADSKWRILLGINLCLFRWLPQHITPVVDLVEESPQSPLTFLWPFL